ncbi:hypothetical protein EUX98_g1221 [Antrodiella citrinella]|uniref:Aminopeptidase n=1 Tax=Antrodiella citrinella TaxID=2447956 RepID=A0A4S4N242_9APHY|nr:hypothetical protein EUX98_g1221 [Antrodiella citrinella]
MASESTTAVEDKHRLPTNAMPIHYDVTIATDLQRLKYYGSTVVHLDIVETSTKLVFNVSALKLRELSVTSSALAEPQSFALGDIQIDETSQRASVTLSSDLPAGSKAALRVGFEGELTSSMKGYYCSSWKHDGKTEHYSLTHFEPTSARHAFPCWDEPALKASFSVTMISKEGTVNLSNMPSISEDVYTPNTLFDVPWLGEKLSSVVAEDGKQWKVVKFEKTPPMSTYIVAFANGPFVYKESSYKSPLSGKVRSLRVYATSDLIDKVDFALDVKLKVVPLYEEVFDIEYPLPKLDTLVMGEIVILDKVFPEWKPHSGFIAGHLARALKLDANSSSHSIEVDCPDANMVNQVKYITFVSEQLADFTHQIFDGLSYSKAASVLRMLYKYAGDESFMRGVSTYLRDHLYANTITEDLWKGLKASTGIDVSRMMDNWIKKVGFPVVTVTEIEGGIHVKQDRFLESGPAETQDNQTLWTIPLFVLTVSDDGQATIDNRIVLDEREQTIPLNTKNLFKLNAGTLGVYHVKYSGERLSSIAQEAVKKVSVFSLEDRMGLVMDGAALAKAGVMKTSDVLALIDFFRHETENVVWKSISDSLSQIVSVWGEHQRIQPLLKSFTRGLYVPHIQRLGYEPVEGESIDDRESRNRAIIHAATAGDPTVIKELKDRYAQFIATGSIHPELERVSLKNAVKYGGRAEFDAMKAIAKEPKTPSLCTSALLAMAAVQDEALISEIFDSFMEEVRDQNLVYLFFGLSNNYKYRSFAVKKFQERYDWFEKRFAGNFTLQTLVRISHSGLSSMEMHKQAEDFFKTKDTSKFNMTLNQALDGIAAKAAWVERSSDDILEWLEKKERQ